MIIHKKVKHCKKYVQGRGFIFDKRRKYVHGKGLMDTLAAKDPELAISGISVGKAVKDLKSMANAKKAASEIKNNNISIGKGFCVI